MRRAERSEFVKASERRVWRITAVAVVAIVGMTLAVLALLWNAGTVSRLSADEDCLHSVVVANSERSSVLSELSKKRTDADAARQHWTTVQNEVIHYVLHPQGKVDTARARLQYDRANRHYLAADARWQRLDTRYNQAAQAHPVPELHCEAGHLSGPVPTVTASTTTTTTAHATSTATSTKTHTAAPPTATVSVPGPTSTVHTIRTPLATRTVTQTRTVTATPSCLVALNGQCVTLLPLAAPLIPQLEKGHR